MEIKNRYLSAKRALFDRVYGEYLNPEQRRAVFTVKGPLLVLAGAGTGKTTVLVNRISYIIKYGNAYASETVPQDLTEEGVRALEESLSLPTESIAEILPEFTTENTPPWSILAITFTNKAAREIRDRLTRALGDESISSSIWAGTFHSVCLRILRRYGDRIGYREGFSIYDTDDKKRMVALCMKELEIDEKRLAPKAVCDAISRAKDSLVYPEDFEITSDPRTRHIKEIYSLYTKRMMANNALDFDDIIMKTVELLESDAEVRGYYQNRFRFTLVDEYQDTNYAQFVLTKLLTDENRNIMVVGDDDQSIYRFRGATVENILNFDKTYPDATVVKLEQNYRSTEVILEAANSVISHNPDRHSKSLWSALGKGSPITLRTLEDQNAEGKYIVDKISAAIRGEGRKYSDFAVLYRINALGRSLQTAFAKSGVPFKVVGDLGFYDRKEIKDMIAYLAVISSSSDNLRLKRIINEPKRKIGASTVEAIENIANAEGCSMLSVIERAGEYVSLAKSSDKLAAFFSLIEGIRSRGIIPSELIRAVFEESGYREMLLAEGFEGETKIENVEELISAAVEYESRCRDADTEPTLSEFLEELALLSDVDKYDENADAVVLMTVHAAKGLEFPVVFLAGMEDGIFPGEQNIGDPEEMSEERRLAYVAITRAKKQLNITAARSRTMYGKTHFNPLSIFIRAEIPRSLIDEERPRSAAPRAADSSYRRPVSSFRQESVSAEWNRRPDALKQKERSSPASFGLSRLEVGTRVEHSLFGSGTVTASRDMGGDILYTVKFDDGQEKRLMATFAKLRKI